MPLVINGTFDYDRPNEKYQLKRAAEITSFRLSSGRWIKLTWDAIEVESLNVEIKLNISETRTGRIGDTDIYHVNWDFPQTKRQSKVLQSRLGEFGFKAKVTNLPECNSFILSDFCIQFFTQAGLNRAIHKMTPN